MVNFKRNLNLLINKPVYPIQNMLLNTRTREPAVTTTQPGYLNRVAAQQEFDEALYTTR